ncbi:MAG: NAD(P)(+) transhydrogenase (Re/Si-specific) subunit beta [Bacteroidota bacterium]|nr:NAD(P)(+) transhydrogenase (Re/Si-specific) subunit beta [Bacteroidota bacterium]
MQEHILQIVYLIASITFIVGLKFLGNPATARRGNLIAAFGMGMAIFGTIFLFTTKEGNHLGNLGFIFVALIIGTIIGWMVAKKVKMTAMPEMVSLFNGMGGACAMLISVIEFQHLAHMGNSSLAPENITGHMLAIMLGLIIGSVSFAGSMVAWGKLSGNVKDKSFGKQQFINIGLLLVILVLGYMVVFGGSANAVTLFYFVLALSLLYGVLFVLPIGGADMPVVISLLNSFTGVAAACGGFLYDNKVMMVGGILVGSAGTLLTIVMCKAMNRSLINVLIGNFGGGSTNAAATSENFAGSVKEINASDAAILMRYAKKVIIVPGYGLAVAQAQHVVHDLELLLEAEGVEVKYAIHPVAGRMPGHMNVLLAESNVSYDKLVEMDEINPEFKSTDVVLVVGANDVVNPAAKSDPNSPIFGMPILEVEEATNVIVNKRSMKAGYAGIENELFYKPKTSMLFGDAKKALTQLVAEIKALG